MSAKSRKTTGDTRIFMVLHIQVYKEFLAKEGVRKISIRFREAVDELQHSEFLRNELREFYRKHSQFFSQEINDRTGKQIQLHAPVDAPDFLNTLSFFVLGYGNVSRISRILMYYSAVRSKWLPAPPLGRISKKEIIEHPIIESGRRLPVSPLRSKRNDPNLAAYTVDTLFSGFESTESDLTALAALTRLGKSATVRYLIEQAAIGNTPQKIRRFYNRKLRLEKEEGVEPQGEVMRIRYRVTPKLDKTLDKLADAIIGLDPPNRSLTLRTIIDYSAVTYGVRPK